MRIAQFLCVILTAVLGALPTHALARDPFITGLEGCLELLQSDSAEPRYQIVLGPNWSVALFKISKDDGGNLGSDMCGDLSASEWDMGGAYAWPASLGELKPVNQQMITRVWLDQIIDNARASSKNRAPIKRISITMLPDGDGHLTRVQFVSAEAKAEASDSVDLDEQANVVTHDPRLPDQFARVEIDASVPKMPAESVSAPSADPKTALSLLLSITQAQSDAKVIRVTLTNFDAGLVYRNQGDAQTRQARFDFTGGEAGNLADEPFEFPAAFKECAMTLTQVEAAIGKIILQKRYQAIAARLQYLLLECSKENPKPHWFLTAMEPFEYFELPAQF
jgi:hypothetical protein